MPHLLRGFSVDLCKFPYVWHFVLNPGMVWRYLWAIKIVVWLKCFMWKFDVMWGPVWISLGVKDGRAVFPEWILCRFFMYWLLYGFRFEWLKSVTKCLFLLCCWITEQTLLKMPLSSVGTYWHMSHLHKTYLFDF